MKINKSDFELVLNVFVSEPTTNIPENELRQIENNAFRKIKKYSTDEI